MRAIILAAGAGTRLSPLTDSCPKCLVSVGGIPLIDYQLQALRAAGVSDIVLVVGYEHEQVRRHCGAAARYVMNADYASTNSIYSLYLAAAEMDSELFLFNCDIVFDARILQRMLAVPGGSSVAVDSRVPRVPGEMNVAYGADRRISRIDKQLDPREAQGQSVQLACFDRQGALAVRDQVAALVAAARRDAFPTSAYGPLIRAGSLFAVEAGDLAWGEIDSLDDHTHVENDILPRLGNR